MAATTITRASLTDSTSPTTGDIWNATLVGTAIYDKIDALFTASITIERSTSGDIQFVVSNASNTSGSDALFQALVAGSSAGDPYITWAVSGATAWSMGIDNDDNDLLKISVNGIGATNTLVFNSSGHAFMNDTTDADVTLGLTINQGANDDSILVFKSSDVAHGMTTNRETDTYADFRKASAADGGLQLSTWSEGTGALVLVASHTTDNTTKSNAASGTIILDSYVKSGTTIAGPGANANLVVMRAGGSTRFIFDAEGDSHEDGTGWTAYDAHDDLALVDAVDRTLDPTLMEREASAFLREQRGFLEAARIVAFDRDGRPFINKSRLGMLHNGALRQLWRQLQALTERVSTLETAA